jgi:hypothetical protein
VLWGITMGGKVGRVMGKLVRPSRKYPYLLDYIAYNGGEEGIRTHGTLHFRNHASHGMAT